MIRWLVLIVKVLFRRNIMGKGLKENTCSKESLQYQSIGSILTSRGLKKISVQDNLSFTRGRFKTILKVNLDEQILYLLFLLEIRKKQVNTIFKIHWWNIIRTIQIVVALLVYQLRSMRQEK